MRFYLSQTQSQVSHLFSGYMEWVLRNVLLIVVVAAAASGYSKVSESAYSKISCK